MLQEFTLNRDLAIINFSIKYCDNRQKSLAVMPSNELWVASSTK